VTVEVLTGRAEAEFSTGGGVVVVAVECADSSKGKVILENSSFMADSRTCPARTCVALVDILISFGAV